MNIPPVCIERAQKLRACAEAFGFEWLGASGDYLHMRKELPGKFFIHASAGVMMACNERLKFVLAAPTGERIEKASATFVFRAGTGWAIRERRRWLRLHGLKDDGTPRRPSNPGTNSMGVADVA